MWFSFWPNGNRVCLAGSLRNLKACHFNQACFLVFVIFRGGPGRTQLPHVFHHTCNWIGICVQNFPVFNYETLLQTLYPGQQGDGEREGPEGWRKAGVCVCACVRPSTCVCPCACVCVCVYVCVSALEGSRLFCTLRG